MELVNHRWYEFDLKLAIECSNAYSGSTGLGCMVLGADGEVLHEVGYNCSNCTVCSMMEIDRDGCAKVHAYGTGEAERFGGKYVYFCPIGLNYFVSPIVGLKASAAKVTVGPFLMTDLDDFIDYDLKNLRGMDNEKVKELLPALREIPYVEPSRVNSLSTLLFMAVGFINNVSATNRMLDNQASDFIQGQVNDYIIKLKIGANQEELPQYPFDVERDLLESVTNSDRPKAQRLLNELLGHIFFATGGDFQRIKSRIYELLIMLSRAAVDAGASPEHTFQLTHDFFTKSQDITNIDNLCFSLTKITNKFIESIFAFSDVKNVNVIHKALQFMHQNYYDKVSLSSVSQVVDLTPSYFSKLFKKEMGCNFNVYMNMIRIEKSIALLKNGNLTLSNIATAVGFEDQSYFTKVFKRVTGVSPNHFMRTRGRTASP
jgi:AraC-like DNA-binding protein/ligand-binding sensor protein